MIRTQFASTVKIFRSDNGSEFFNNDCKIMFESTWTIHQSSCPHTPQQNGVVERKHRHILEVARVLRFQGSIPIRFWGECVLTAVYLINKLPTPMLKGKSPYEVLHKHKASLDHLRVVGCLFNATKIVKVDKFSPRAAGCAYLGYSATQKGYNLFDLHDKKILVSRDVKFHENVFLLKIDSSKCLPDLTSIHATPVQFDKDEHFLVGPGIHTDTSSVSNE